jgi:drug/metabolite transporter (DMT)-like permease
MSETRPYSGPAWLAFVMAGIAAATLIAAIVNTPLSEWNTMSYIFGVVITLFVAAFAISGVRGGFNLVGRRSAKTTMIFSAIGVVAAIVVLIGSVFADVWDQSTILTFGLWLALLVMFAAGWVESRKNMRAGD